MIPKEKAMDLYNKFFATTPFNVNSKHDEITRKRPAKMLAKRYKVVECECPDCDGSGFVDYVFEDHKRKKHEIEETCPTCENETDFTMITEIETGNDIEGFQELIKIHNSLFDVNHFEKMIETAEMLNVKTIKITNKRSDTSIHKFVVGECTICLVPVTNFDDCDVVTNIA